MSIARFRGVLAMALICTSGCTIVDSSSILVGDQRTPTSASQIKIYSSAPTKYREIAIVSAKAGHDFKSEQSVMDSAMQALREEAARLGANGIILQNVHTRSEPTVTTGLGTGTVYGTGGVATGSSTFVGVSNGDSYNKISGLAIWVEQDSPVVPAGVAEEPVAAETTSGDLISDCKAIEDKIFYAPARNPTMPETEKDALRAKWQAIGCAGAKSSSGATKK